MLLSRTVCFRSTAKCLVGEDSRTLGTVEVRWRCVRAPLGFIDTQIHLSLRSLLSQNVLDSLSVVRLNRALRATAKSKPRSLINQQTGWSSSGCGQAKADPIPASADATQTTYYVQPEKYTFVYVEIHSVGMFTSLISFNENGKTTLQDSLALISSYVCTTPTNICCGPLTGTAAGWHLTPLGNFCSSLRTCVSW